MPDVRLPLILPGPGAPLRIDASSFIYPKRIPITTSFHCAMTQDPEEARQFYTQNGVMARRKSNRDGCVRYRFPWRLWRYRNRSASGDWRRVDANEPMALVGIALVDPPDLRAGASGYPSPAKEALDAWPLRRNRRLRRRDRGVRGQPVRQQRAPRRARRPKGRVWIEKAETQGIEWKEINDDD